PALCAGRRGRDADGGCGCGRAPVPTARFLGRPRDGDRLRSARRGHRCGLARRDRPRVRRRQGRPARRRGCARAGVQRALAGLRRAGPRRRRRAGGRSGADVGRGRGGSRAALRGDRMTRAVKAVADRVAAAVLLLLFSPFLLTIVLWIWLDDGRPALLSQERAGKDGVPFRMLKFRTMVRDALEAGRRLGLEDPWGVLPDDPRITRSGRFLRRTSLDELPQLINVLKGEMSLVGPRPDLVEQVANYSTRDRRRLAVRPGITGWSQVQGREEIGWPERFEQDAWYIEHWSLRLDAKIVLATFAQLFRSDEAPVEDTMNIERARARENG